MLEGVFLFFGKIFISCFVFIVESDYREEVSRILKRFTKILSLVTALLMVLCMTAAYAETEAEGEEQGVDEILQMMDISDVEQTEGMGLEEMTEAFTESAMGEYLDAATGFSMQYPSIFQFDENTGNTAATTDGKATLSIENYDTAGGLTKEALLEAIKREVPDFKPGSDDNNGCIRVDRKKDGSTMQTDLYYLTGKSFHHIILTYPAGEEEKYSSYIEYMINTMETNDTDLG